MNSVLIIGNLLLIFISTTMAQRPVDGNWTTWESWTSCSETCDAGTKSRSRLCTDPSAAHGGQTCPGNSYELTSCNLSDCNSSRTFTCPIGWILFHETNQCYFKEEERLTPADAEANCRSKDSFLTSVHSQREHDFLSELSGTGQPTWIGFTDSAVEGQWVWMDGTTVDFINWYPSEPSNHGGSEHWCVIGKVGEKKWSDRGRYARFGSICKMDSTEETVTGMARDP